MSLPAVPHLCCCTGRLRLRCSQGWVCVWGRGFQYGLPLPPLVAHVDALLDSEWKAVADARGAEIAKLKSELEALTAASADMEKALLADVEKVWQAGVTHVTTHEQPPSPLHTSRRAGAWVLPPRDR